MAQKYYATEPIWLTLSDNPGTLQYVEVLWNIMRMLLMSEGNEEYNSMDAESALEELDEMPMEEFNKLKARAKAEYADPQFQEYLERIDLCVGGRNAPTLEPVENLLYEPEEGGAEPTEEETLTRLMERLDEMDWQGFQLWELDNSCEMD